MSDLQKQVLTQTVQTIRPFRWKPFLLNGTVSATLVILLMWLLTQQFDWAIWTILILITFVYLFFRDAFLQLNLRKQFERQYTYTQEKNPDVTLYIPLFDNARGTLIAKNAAIVFAKDACGLITFKQPLFSRTPTDSIRVPLGKDFQLSAMEVAPDKPMILLDAFLMGTPFRFCIWKSPETIAIIEPVIGSVQKDV